MLEDTFNALTGKNGDDKIGKDKILVQCLDVSGSMAGAPLKALKMGAQLIGEKYFEAEEKPFEAFHTFLYSDKCKSF